MSIVLDVNLDQLLETVKDEQRAVVLVWIRSCSACAKFKPIFNQLPEHFPETRFLRMNQLKTIENLRYSEGKEMDETPTTFVYCNGAYVESIVGYHSLEETKTLLNTIFNNINC